MIPGQYLSPTTFAFTLDTREELERPLSARPQFKPPPNRTRPNTAKAQPKPTLRTLPDKAIRPTTVVPHAKRTRENFANVLDPMQFVAEESMKPTELIPVFPSKYISANPHERPLTRTNNTFSRVTAGRQDSLQKVKAAVLARPAKQVPTQPSAPKPKATRVARFVQPKHGVAAPPKKAAAATKQSEEHLEKQTLTLDLTGLCLNAESDLLSREAVAVISDDESFLQGVPEP